MKHEGPTLMFAYCLVGGTGFAQIVTPEIVESNTKVGGGLQGTKSSLATLESGSRGGWAYCWGSRA